MTEFTRGRHIVRVGLSGLSERGAEGIRKHAARRALPVDARQEISYLVRGLCRCGGRGDEQKEQEQKRSQKAS